MATVTVADGAGEPVASVGALRVRQARLDQLQRMQGQRSEHLYRVEFGPVALETAAEAAPGVVLGGSGALATQLGVEWHVDLPSLLAQANDGRLPKRVIVDATESVLADQRAAFEAKAATDEAPAAHEPDTGPRLRSVDTA